jgi:hypothetical protein
MLLFDEATHTYTYNGKVVPSVTQIIKAAGLADWSMVKPEVLEAARNRGVAVHRMIELHVKDTLDYSTLDPALLPYLEGWMAFERDHDVEVIGSEVPVYSKRYGYAGTLDMVLKVDETHGTWDIKSGVMLPTTGLQLAGYSEAHAPGSDIYQSTRRGLQLTDTGKYKITKFDNQNDLNVFLSCLNIYNWRNKK